jgi:hypothetical protein
MQQQKNYDKTSPLGIRILGNKPYYVTLFRGGGILSGYVTRTKKILILGKDFWKTCWLVWAAATERSQQDNESLSIVGRSCSVFFVKRKEN